MRTTSCATVRERSKLERSITIFTCLFYILQVLKRDALFSFRSAILELNYVDTIDSQQNNPLHLYVLFPHA